MPERPLLDGQSVQPLTRLLTPAQHRERRRIAERWHVIRSHRESFASARLFVYIDDGASNPGLDGITHEVQVFPDGLVLGEPDEDYCDA